MFQASAQDRNVYIPALNDVISFSNESVHGLLIIHRLLENFNQDINKYVDLDAYELNLYSNKDLPKDIFLDEEHWFYEVSPKEWYDKSKLSLSTADLPEAQDILATITVMRNICKAINNLRFNIDDYIAAHDLNKNEDLQGVYELLEKGVKMYEDFHIKKLELEAILTNLNISNGTEYKVFDDILTSHKSNISFIRALRAKDDGMINSLYDALNLSTSSAIKELSSIKSNSPLLNQTNAHYTNRIRSKLKDFQTGALKFIKEGTVPQEYHLYGRFYYYHNSDLINKVNRYGNGYVNETNQLIKSLGLNRLQLLDEPHYYQVIYPKRLVPESHILSSDNQIDLIPIELKERKIVQTNRVIEVDDYKLELNLYDHMIQDGDIVSINFNGDWLLESYSLESKPITLKLQLNKEGKNFLLMHAESVGRKPPNTMAISYKYKGEEKKITLKSDLNTSELIEFKVKL